jgi:hypothetical protein
VCAATGCPTHTTGGCTAVSHVARSVEGRLRCRVRGGGRAVVVVWLLLVVAVKGAAVVDLPLRVVCCSAHKWSGRAPAAPAAAGACSPCFFQQLGLPRPSPIQAKLLKAPAAAAGPRHPAGRAWRLSIHFTT